MARESPVAVLYDANGVALSALNGVAIPANTPGIHAMVSDGASSRYLRSDPNGALIVRPKQLPTFVAIASAVVPGNNKNMMSLRNGNAAQIVRLRQLYAVNRQTTAVSGVAATWELKRYTTEVGLAVITPELADTSVALPASITVGTGGTLTGEAVVPLQRWFWSTDEWGPGNVDAEVDALKAQQTVSLYSAGSEETPITLRSGQGIFVKFATNSTAGSWDIRMVFTTEVV